MMRILLVAFAATALLTSHATAQWFVRGDFNAWTNSTNPMIHQGGGHYTYTASGLAPGQTTEFKVTVDDWSENYPGSNGKIVANAAGQIVFHFYDNASWADGWNPANEKRVGYDDPMQFTWDVPGDMNGWNPGPEWQLSSVGGGLYRGEFVMPAGTHNFKFRKAGDWDISIGDNFGNAAANNSVTVDSSGDLWAFELDLPGGRWRAYYVPEPASLSLVGLAGIALLARRRGL